MRNARSSAGVLLSLSLCLGFVLGCKAKSEPAILVDAIDPFIGTGGVGWGVGSTYPGPHLPFGMIHPGPDTRSATGAPGFNHCAGYWHHDEFIEGFSLTRMEGTGAPDYGNIGWMPTDGFDATKITETGYAESFSHDKEEAEIGYYSVRLDNDIQIEITAAKRAAIFRFTFPASISKPTILLDLEHTIGDGVSDGGEIALDSTTGAIDGWMHNQGNLSDRIGGFPTFVAANFNVTPSTVGVWDDSGVQVGAETAQGIDLGGWFEFPAGTTEVVMRVAISFVDGNGARSNLESEAPDYNFEQMREVAHATWNHELQRIQLIGASEEDVTRFATAMMRTLSMPTLWSDADGRTVAVDGSILTQSDQRYTDFSLWDTYRTLHPWLLFVEDVRNTDILNSFVTIGEEGGGLPRWELAHGDVHSMIGDPGVIVAAEADAKSLQYREDTAYPIAWTTAWGPSPGPTGGRSGIGSYVANNYVAADEEGGSVAKTLESVAADLALAEWADRRGQTADAAALRARVETAVSALFDAQEGFFKPKNADGTWAFWPGPLSQEGAYTEGTAWQYLWLLLQDTELLAQTLGGREAALERLRVFFSESESEEDTLGLRNWYWHGNEPDIHAPWLFSAWGSINETVRWVDWVVAEMYGTGPDGLPGNDDGATLSAWYLFAHAGLYPIAGTDRYLLGAPRQERMVVRRPLGDLIIEASPDPTQHRVVERILLDGDEVEGTILTHESLTGFHRLTFEMAE